MSIFLIGCSVTLLHAQVERYPNYAPVAMSEQQSKALAVARAGVRDQLIRDTHTVKFCPDGEVVFEEWNGKLLVKGWSRLIDYFGAAGLYTWTAVIDPSTYKLEDISLTPRLETAH